MSILFSEQRGKISSLFVCEEDEEWTDRIEERKEEIVDNNSDNKLCALDLEEHRVKSLDEQNNY